MAVTRITDLAKITEVFDTYGSEIGPEKNELFTSGLISRDASLDMKAGMEGATFITREWKDIDNDSEFNYGNDDPASIVTAKAASAQEMIGRKSFVNEWYGAADLTRELAGSDAIGDVIRKIDKAFTSKIQGRVLAMAQGIYDDNVVNNASDMVVTVASEAAGSETAATRFNDDAFLEAVYTMGDASDKISAMIVHSKVAKVIAKLQDYQSIPSASGQTFLRSYKGVTMYVDDSMTAVAGTTGSVKYRTILMGADSFRFGDTGYSAKYKDDPMAGGGQGVTSVGFTDTMIIHPQGFSYATTPAAGAALSFTNTELKAAANVSRVTYRKNAPFAFLETN
jgi:hypothetical protein